MSRRGNVETVHDRLLYAGPAILMTWRRAVVVLTSALLAAWFCT